MQKLPRAVDWLLRMYPREFRREYGQALRESLERKAADAGAAGGVRWRFWLRESLSLLSCALRERWRALRDRVSDRHPFVPPTPRGILMDQLLRELRQALRRLLHSPVFGIAAVLTLALAIGANAAIFTLVRRVVLYPFPYRDADRLVLLEHTAPEIPQARGIGLTINLFEEYLAHSAVLEDAALFQNGASAVRVNDVAERVPNTRTTPNLSSVLGVQPMLGRWLRDSDAVYGSPVRVVVLSYGFWQRVYGGDPQVLGKIMYTNGTWPLEIVGVMPPEFRFPRKETQFWLPFVIAPQDRRDRGFNYEAVARLRSGVTIPQLRTDLSAVIERYETRLKGEGAFVQQMHAVAEPQSLRDNTLGTMSRAIWILFAAVGVVLLIACANVANLFLVRVESKQRDLAVRRALGAGQRGVALYFLSESVLLGLISGVLGFLMALAAVQLLVTFGPSDLPRLELVQVDNTVALFTLGVALLAGLLLGALPLLRSGGSVAGVLHEASRGNTGGRRERQGRSVLAAVQIALALVLLVTAGLVLRSYDRLQRTPIGFQTDQRLMFRVTFSEQEYGALTAAIQAQQQLLGRVRALPGVSEASATTCFPLEMCWGADVTVEKENRLPGQEAPVIWHRRVAPGYFRVMGSRLVRGRDFSDADFQSGTRSVIINQALADIHLPGQDPVGKRLSTTGAPPDSAWKWLTIVGVVENMVGTSRTENVPVPQVYVPVSTPAENTPSAHSMVYVVRSSGPPLDLLPAIRRAVSQLYPNVPVTDAETVSARVQRATAQLRFTMILLLIAATVALLLGVIGVYGVISYSVAQRSTEVGVRVALGAAPGQVVGMIVREGAVVIGAGVLLGLLGTLATTRVLSSLLFGVSRADPMTYGAVSLTLAGFALLACYIPARRAARLDPGQAMRVRP